MTYEKLLEEIKKEFERRLERKTGWGRVEVLKEYDFSVELVIKTNASFLQRIN